MKKTAFIKIVLTLFVINSLCLNSKSCFALFEGKKIVSHKILVQEVVQTSNYTYLHGKVNDSADSWLAVPTMEAKAGDIYFYAGGLPMTKFVSKELNRTFDLVLFLGEVSKEPISEAGAKPVKDTSMQGHHADAQVYKRKAVADTKKDLKIDVPADCITIAQLLTKKDDYAGKTVKIKGQVTKFNAGIMYKNWIHLQDGTDLNGKYDLVITSPSEVKVGDIVILEGIVSVNKDFGYGYAFDIMIENAIVK